MHETSFIKSAASLGSVGALIIGLGACSSVQPPREQIATAELALREARSTTAPQHAPLELRLATEKLEKAKNAMREEDYVLARRLAEQALVDAQLAQSKAHSAEAQQSAAQLRRGIENLRQELDRRGNSG